MELRRRGTEERTALAHGMVIGRQPSCELQVDDPSVSRKHARVERHGADYAIVDLDSSNGVFRNGQRAPRVELRAGDLLTLGTVAFDVVGSVTPLTGRGAVAASDDEVFEVPVEPGSEVPVHSAQGKIEAERSRLRQEHGHARRSRGFGDISQQPTWLRFTIYGLCLLVAYGIMRGIRFLAGGV